MWSAPICSSTRAMLASSGGASPGCRVMRTCSRIRSAGGRSTQGTSARTPRQVLLARHRKLGSQVKPDSISTRRSAGNLAKTPSWMMLSRSAWKACERSDDVLEMVGGPAIAAGGVAGGGAGVDADRQAVALGGRVDRPVLRMAERGVAGGEQQDLDEAGVGGAAVDLGGGGVRVLRGDDDRGAKPGFAVEPLGGDPVVQRGGQGGGEMPVEQGLDAVEAVQDGEARAEAVQHVAAQSVRGRSRACRPAGANRGAR